MTKEVIEQICKRLEKQTDRDRTDLWHNARAINELVKKQKVLKAEITLNFKMRSELIKEYHSGKKTNPKK